MGLDDFAPIDESGDVGGNSGEAAREVSEKFKDSVKRATAGTRRTKKDEQKAKKHDLLLANFLIKFILDKKYDSILGFLFKAMDAGYPSNFLLGILSLIDIEISNEIRGLAGEEQIIFDYMSPEKIEFHDDALDEKVKIRINNWLEDMNFVISIEYSSLLTKQLIGIFDIDDEILKFTSSVFSFFLKEINIVIDEDKSLNISEFILSEVKKSVVKLDIQEI